MFLALLFLMDATSLLIADGDTLTSSQKIQKKKNRRQKSKRRQKRKRIANPPTTHADVRYGKYKRNVLDIWLAKSESPTPLIVYIHGGGFVAGSKRSLNRALLRDCLKSGISVAAIHYRFVTTAMFPAPQKDSARAIQFLRYRAKDWNLDPKRFAAFGGSAGAGISMWLAFHDDMADAKSDDPVLRQSSRLSCVGSFGGQPTYDPNVMKAWVGGRVHEHPSIFKCYNIKSIEEIHDPKLQSLFDEVSAITHLTKDDPPVFQYYSQPNRPLPKNARPGQGVHHPIFGLKLKAELDKLKIANEYVHRDNFRGNPFLKMLAFFKTHLE